MGELGMKFFFSRILPILLIGLGAGLLNGLLGAGGGILIVFGLKRLLGERLADPRSVFASAIAVMLPLSLVSAVQYFKNGQLDAENAGILILPAVLGGVVGALLLRRLSPAALSRLFSVVVVASGVFLLL